MKYKGKEHDYPVSRKNDHTTFLACITTDGNYLNPLIIIKRQTIDIRFCREPILDKIILASSESDFINSDIFDKRLEKHFVPYIKEMRKKNKYTRPAVLLFDCCSSNQRRLICIMTEFFN